MIYDINLIWSVDKYKFYCCKQTCVIYLLLTHFSRLTVDLVTLNNVMSALEQHNLKQSTNDSLIGVPDMVKVLTTIYQNIEVPADLSMTSNEFCVDLTLNWLLNVYDR